MLEKLSKILIERGLTISTAESCTGGLVSSMLTDVSGSSAYVKLNLVTYSNEAKHRMLNVKSETLDKYGAVSEQCAYEMAEGLMDLTACDVALCTTGIAGPTGGSDEKPVGLCFVSCKFNGKIFIKKVLLDKSFDRIMMKKLFAENAIEFAYEVLTRK